MAARLDTDEPVRDERTRGTRGAFWVLVADGLALPSGLVVASLLGRSLGPSLYGQYAIAAAIVIWIEWGLVAFFTRSSIQFVAQAEAWRPIASAVLRVQFGAALALTAVVVAVTTPFAETNDLAAYVRLFALDIPFAAIASVQRSVLVGTGYFRGRAAVAAARWISRAVFIAVLVGFGLSVWGAILGSVAATAAEMAIGRMLVRIPLTVRSSFRLTKLASHSAPVFLGLLAPSLAVRLDLFAVEAFGVDARSVGHYAAAHTLAVVPKLFALTIGQISLSVMARAIADDDEATMRAAGLGTIRLLVLLIPFVGLTAGVAPEVVLLVYGSAFEPAALLLSILIAGGLAWLASSVATSMLTVLNRTKAMLALNWLPLAGAAIAYPLAIPRYGATGAAVVSTATALASALLLLVLAARALGIGAPVATLARSLLLCVAAFAATWAAGPVTTWIVAAAVMLLLPVCYFVLGEIGARDVATVRSLVSWRGTKQPQPGVEG